MSQSIDTHHIAELAVAGAGIKHHPKYNPVVLVPSGYSAQELKETPLREEIEQRVTLDTAQSFIDYVVQFKSESTRIFSSVTDKGASFVSVLDYHWAPVIAGRVETDPDGASFADDPAAANWCKHRATFDPAYTAEFAAWLGANKKPMTQEQFIDFLRRWGYTVYSHASADLEEYLSNLEFRTNGTFKNKLERVKGGRALVWIETVEGASSRQGAEVPIIERVSLNTPVLYKGASLSVEASLSYKVIDGTLRITPELRQEHVVIQSAVEELIWQVEEGAKLKVYRGRLA
jgi:hypothetical protein